MSLKIQDLKPQDSRAVYKNINLDLRNYKKLKMYLHAESIEGKDLLPGDGVENNFDERLVAFLRLGNDIDENTNPIEAGLGWITKLDKESFIGKKAIIGLKNNIQRRLVCIEMKEKSIPRKGYLVYRNNTLVGRITSGTMSPSLGIGIGVGYVNLQDTGTVSYTHLTLPTKA